MQLNKMIFDDLINCYKNKNYRYDFATEDLFVDNCSKGVFINMTPLYKEDFKSYIYSRPVYFDKVLPLQQDTFYDEYLEYMENYCSKQRNTRYAIQLKILYPKKIESVNERKQFVKQFVMTLCGLKKPLPYYVENYRQGNGSYAKITIIDRMYLGRKQWMIYKKDVWIDSRTGKFPSQDCPAEYRKLKCKAGDYRLDKDGNRIPSSAVFSNSLRIFVYGKEMETGRNKWIEFLWMLRQKFLDTVLKVCGKTDVVKKGKRLHKTECKPEYHRYVRRRISAINFAKQTVEYTTNYLLKKFCMDDIVYTPYNTAKDDRVIHSEAYKKVLSIFYKYKTRFKNGCFHDQDGNLYQIDYYKQNVYELDCSIQSLLDQFFSDIQALEC